MRKRLFLIFCICVLILGGFVSAFTWRSIENKPEVLTAEDLPPVINTGSTTVAGSAAQKTISSALTSSSVAKPSKTIPAAESRIPAAENTLVIAETQDYDFINEDGKTLTERINTPAGFERVEYAEGSFGAFVRNYALKEHGTDVLFYDGRMKNSDNHIAVFDMFLAERDLQQCADSIMRIIAEYYYAEEQYDKISFDFVSGFECRYDKWIEGERVGFDGNNAFWKEGGTKGATAGTFESYINTVFAYASTLSLEASAKPIKINELQTGDVFIKGGSPGHVVMVADICENADGEKAFLLAQGFMPAQSFHLLKNPASENDPWYYASELGYPFRTPEYTFSEGSLKRLEAMQ
ncbi:MAG: DUF4846 domain-containing protein [Firmicutes bacterium]|nr:DUF4846 domain-containing protein [Bacillota bacterium]